MSKGNPSGAKLPPTPEVPKFRLVAQTQAEEDAYNITEHRNVAKPVGVVGSVAHLVKGALGAGILSVHVAFKTGGYVVGTIVCIFCTIYMAYCLYILGKSAQVLYRRCRVPTMTYSDVGEAAFACSSNSKIANFSKTFRYIVDVTLVVDLFGSCAAYQIIVAKSIKQLVEDVPHTTFEGLNGMPNLRVYLAVMIIPMILICLIRHLKWLAPISIVANVIILICIFVSIYYAFVNNPTFSNMVPYTSFYDFLEFSGMIVFSVSCIGIVLPVENNMRDPTKYGLALSIGYVLIFLAVFSISFFGYAAYLDRSESPITVNFPLNILGKALKGCIVIMVYATHALNYWVPFNTVFFYLKKRHDPSKEVIWEMFYRALFVFLIALTAIIFPTITHIIGFLGSLCVTTLAFVFPNLIYLLVTYERPGFGRYRWRLWLAITMIVVGLFLGLCGTAVSFTELIKTTMAQNK